MPAKRWRASSTAWWKRPYCSGVRTDSKRSGGSVSMEISSSMSTVSSLLRRRARCRTKKGDRPPGRPPCSLRVLDRPGLPDDRDPDLARVAELALDALGDLASHELGGRIVHLLGPDEDADLAAGL